MIQVGAEKRILNLLLFLLQLHRTLGIGGLTASGFMNFFVKGGAAVLLSEILFVTICAYLVAQSNKSEDITTIENLGSSSVSSFIEQVYQVPISDETDIETTLPVSEALVQSNV